MGRGRGGEGRAVARASCGGRPRLGNRPKQWRRDHLGRDRAALGDGRLRPHRALPELVRSRSRNTPDVRNDLLLFVPVALLIGLPVVVGLTTGNRRSAVLTGLIIGLVAAL